MSTGVALVGRFAIPARRSRIVLRDTLAVVVHDPEIELSSGVALVGRLAIPAQRSRIVLRDTPTFVVHDAEIALSTGVALVGCLAIPAQRSRIVLRDTLAVVVHDAEIELSTVVSLLGPRGTASSLRRSRADKDAMVCLGCGVTWLNEGGRIGRRQRSKSCMEHPIGTVLSNAV